MIDWLRFNMQITALVSFLLSSRVHCDVPRDFAHYMYMTLCSEKSSERASWLRWEGRLRAPLLLLCWGLRIHGGID